MEKVFLLFAASLAVIAAAATPTTTTTTTTPAPVPTRTVPELVRCKRHCETFVPCSVGPQIDEHGCPTCKCLADPCKNVTCPEYQTCKAKSCTDKPCTSVVAECKPICPMPMCATRCPFGYKNDKNGCMTCTCSMDPCALIDCADGKVCTSVIGDCPPGENCDMQPKCVDRDPHIDTKTTTTPAECPMFKCAAMACTFGRAKDANGCQTCDCAKHPCEGHTCDDELVCLPKDDGKVIVPHCTVKPLCHHQRDHMMAKQGGHGPQGMMGHDMMGGMLGGGMHHLVRRIARSLHHVPTCTELGDFMPRQCHEVTAECWCVNDRGMEMDGTRKVAKTEEDKPACFPNRTHAVQVHMNLKHDMTDVHPHLPHIKQACRHHISKWLFVKEEQIMQLEVTPNGYNMVEINFVVVQDAEGNVDLASVMYHFTSVRILKAQVPVDAYTFTPVPDSVTTHHEYAPEPMLPAEGGVRQRPASLRFSCFVRDHRLELIVALIGVSFFFIILTTLCCICYKKKAMKAERMKTFQENLAFSNNLYDKANLTLGYDEFDDMKKIPLSDDENNENNREAMA